MRFFAIRLKIAMAIISIALLVFGCISISEAIHFSKQQVMSYEQFVKARPKEGWFKITGGIVSVLESVWVKENDTIKSLYIPVRSSQDSDEKTLYLLIETSDPQTIDQVKAMPQGKDDIKGYVRAHRNEVLQHRDVEGMIEGTSSEDSKTRGELTGLQDSLDPDFVILKEGKHPSMAIGVGALLGGVVLIVLQVLYYVSMRGRRMV